MVRVDSTPLKYHRDEADGAYKPTLDPKHGFKREWNLQKLLGSHENAHVAFTLSVQAVMGAFLLLTLGHWAWGLRRSRHSSSARAYLPALFLMLGLMGGWAVQAQHAPGQAAPFLPGFLQPETSPVSREIAGVSVFFAGLAGYACFARSTVALPISCNACLRCWVWRGCGPRRLLHVQAVPYSGTPVLESLANRRRALRGRP